VIAVTVLAAATAAGCVGRSPPNSPGRLAAALKPMAARKTAGITSSTPRARALVFRWSSAAVILIAGITVGGSIGILLGGAGAALVLLVRPPPVVPRVDPDDVPVVVDLIAGCLAGGAGLPDALDAAAIAAGEVVQMKCRAVANALRSGMPPEEAWQSWLSDPWLAPVARTGLRTTQSGAAAAADLRRTSTRLRARRRAAAHHRVRQASVWLVVPLGLCFLPAFFLVAVVPLVVGLVPSLR
jgi:Flp pilus assembly protein TadB